MSQKSKYLALAGVLVSLAGCATTPSELRNAGPEHRATFVMQQNYQSAYREILARQRACEQASLITASYVVQGDLFTDIQSGTITTALHGATGVVTETVIDIKAAGEGASEVVISTARNAARYAAGVRKWLAGVQEC